MEKLLSSVGSLLYGMRFTMLFFYVGLVAIILGILGKFLLETYKLFTTLLFDDLQKIDLIIKVLELVDMTMVAQLVWVVALAGVSLFVTTGHFDSKSDMKKPDWLDPRQHLQPQAQAGLRHHFHLGRARAQNLPQRRTDPGEHPDRHHGGGDPLHLRALGHRHLVRRAADAGRALRRV